MAVDTESSPPHDRERRVTQCVRREVVRERRERGTQVRERRERGTSGNASDDESDESGAPVVCPSYTELHLASLSYVRSTHC